MTENLATPTRQRAAKSRITLISIVLLIVLADQLMFDHPPGLNLFIMSLAIAAAILWQDPARLRQRDALLMSLLATTAALPLLEAPGPLAIVVAILGLLLLALWQHRLTPSRWIAIPTVLLRFGLATPGQVLTGWAKLRTGNAQRRVRSNLARTIAVWIVPVVFACVFLLLFSAANPIIESVTSQLDPGALLGLLNFGRIAIWLSVAALAWLLLRPRLSRKFRRSGRASTVATTSRNEQLLFGQAAILRSLLVFNLLFAVQTVLDVTYLWGGVALPSGMTLAQYAHRGAYPLIVTAILAAAFTLAAMRKGGAGEQSRAIRWLVYAWIAQNILLCISALLRLDLYVEIYMTELRLAAGIWMVLVAVGLLLILLRIALRQSNTWLIAVNIASLTATLYICAAIDLQALIARFNVEHSQEVSGQGQPLDLYYLASLGPSAIPALDIYRSAISSRVGNYRGVEMVMNTLLNSAADASADWQSWTYRQTRLQHYIEQR